MVKKPVNSAKSNPLSCENNQIWIELNDIIFIKRSSAFYLTDLGLIKFFYVANSRIKFNLTIEILVISNSRIVERQNISDSNPVVDASYVYSIGNYVVKIIEIKHKWEFGGESRIYLRFYSNNSQTRDLLDVIVKNSGRVASDKKSAIICSKCFFLNSDEDYKNMAWWFQLNKMIGYEKVSFCENSIDLSYFHDQTQLIETTSLKCIPNFISKRPKYFTSFTNLSYNGVFSYASTDIFNVIITNECFLSNLDKYKYVTVVDNDETVIPRVTETYTTLEDYHRFLMSVDLDSSYLSIDNQIDAIRCKNTDNRIEKYMDEVNNEPNSETISFYFQQAFYLNDKIIESLIDQLDFKLNSHGEIEKEGFNLTLTSSINKNELDFNLTFRISGRADYEYAVNLVKLSKTYIRPFMNQHRERLAELSENYRRVFALVSEGDNQFTSGKSVHSTNHTRNVCVHSLCGRRGRLVRQSSGHLSHFRRFFVFRKFILFDIKQLVFDFNYFNCFVKPILNKY